MNTDKLKRIEELYSEMLYLIGEDPNRDGLKKTPHRVSKAYDFLMSGYEKDPKGILQSALFDEDHKQIVIVKDIPFYSMCEHHILPFLGKVHIGYYPNGKITGLSKLPRVVEVFSRRLQVQERLTEQICNAISEALEPLGVIVVIEAQHMCMQMRGIEKEGSTTTTIFYNGRFDNPTDRKEFLDLIKR